MEIKVNNLTDEQLKEVSALVKKFEEENEKPKKVIDYENGWVVVIYGLARKSGDYAKSIIDDLFEIGLYRDTKEECEKLIKKMKIEHRLRQWSKMCKDKVDWSDREQEKYYVYYGGTIKIHYYNTVRSNDIYFTDKSVLEKAIEDIGEQKLIDEYFVEV